MMQTLFLLSKQTYSYIHLTLVLSFLFVGLGKIFQLIFIRLNWPYLQRENFTFSC